MLHKDRFDHQNLQQTYLVVLEHPEEKQFFFVKNDFEKRYTNIVICASSCT